jgi:phage terminase small subunit
MPRPRVPVATAKVTGAAEKNPQRHRGRRQPAGIAAIGVPPSWFDQYQKRAWAGFKRELPWLKESHRALLELASMLRGQILLSRGPINLQAMQELRRILGQLGATPADESKVQWGDGDEEDPDEALFAAASGQPH